MGPRWLAEVLLGLGWAQVLCYATDNPSNLPPTCSFPAGNAWWNPLSVNNSDPCQIHQHLIDNEIYTGCCATGVRSVSGVSCGPCNEETYNIVMACFLCAAPQTASLTEPPDHDTVNSAQLPPQLPIVGFGLHKKFSEFKKQGPQRDVSLPFLLVPWMNVKIKADLFDAKGAVEVAKSNPPTSPDQPGPSPPAPAPPSNPSKSIQSSPGTTSASRSPISSSVKTSPIVSSQSTSSSLIKTSSLSTSVPVPSLPGMQSESIPALPTPTATAAVQPSETSSPSSQNQARAIAGGVVGGLAGLIVIIGTAYYMHRRRQKARIPASAKFISFSHAHPRGDLPPPFSPGEWDGPIIEKGTAM